MSASAVVGSVYPPGYVKGLLRPLSCHYPVTVTVLFRRRATVKADPLEVHTSRVWSVCWAIGLSVGRL
eukprot:1132562-Pyramimonas_sp.AAC.1